MAEEYLIASDVAYTIIHPGSVVGATARACNPRCCALHRQGGSQYTTHTTLTPACLPGGLLDQPGGQRQLVVGRHDSLLDSATRTVPRADVAEVVVQVRPPAAPWCNLYILVLLAPLPGVVGLQALLEEAALNLDFDLASGPEGQEAPPPEWDIFFEDIAGLK